ncbi:MAG: MucR family transcriptional regulator [Sphingomonadales bacterium]|nr:MucR family transcriptional regulator [Sphingomonadales bacterium]
MAQALVPAVSIRSSVKPETITCLDCGKKMQTLKRHLRVSRDLSALATYDFARLPAIRRCPKHAQSHALKIGLGRKLEYRKADCSQMARHRGGMRTKLPARLRCQIRLQPSP